MNSVPKIDEEHSRNKFLSTKLSIFVDMKIK